jgi:hypothetical protein
MKAVILECRKIYSRFAGDSPKDDIRHFHCSEENYLGIKKQMVAWGWQVSETISGEIDPMHLA